LSWRSSAGSLALLPGGVPTDEEYALAMRELGEQEGDEA
jgi:hypothetical protein